MASLEGRSEESSVGQREKLGVIQSHGFFMLFGKGGIPF